MSKRIIGLAHVFHDGELVTLNPGDILPDWAEDIVTNPAVVEDIEDDVAPDPEPVIEPEKPKRGRPRKQEAEPVIDGRAALEAKATALGVEFTDETTDAELEVIIASKE